MSAGVKSEDAAEIKKYTESLFSRYGGVSDPLIAGLSLRRLLLSAGGRINKNFHLFTIYSHYSAEEVYSVIEQEISRLVSSSVLPGINRFIDDCDFRFYDAVSDEGSVAAEFIRERIYSIFKKSLDSGKGAIIFNSTWNILRYEIVERYLKEIFTNDGEICRGLKKELPVNFTLKDSINFIQTIIIMRPSLYPEINSGAAQLSDDQERRGVAIRAERSFRPVSLRIIDEALKSFIPAGDSWRPGGIAGLIYIFDYLCRITPWQGNGGAVSESPHKSWFSIALINAEYFGFNKWYLEELFSIAGEKNW